MPQITNIMMFTTAGFRDTNSALIPHIPTEPRAQPANNCRQAMLTRFVYDSMSSKICPHLGMQKETLNLR